MFLLKRIASILVAGAPRPAPALACGDPIAPRRSRHLVPVLVLTALVACSPGKPPSQAAVPVPPPASAPSTRPQLPYKIPLSYDEVRPLLSEYQADLPTSLRGRDASAQAAAWHGWVNEHDAGIRARLAHGDEDSILNL